MGWISETYQDRQRFALRVERTVYEGESDLQRVVVVETPAFGRVLVLDGVLMTSEAEEFFYHEMIVHPALVAHGAARRVLVIGGGDGGTVREVLRHPWVERVVMVEIDPEVVRVCRTHLSAVGGAAWEDPRLEVVFADGVEYATAEADGAWDAVILDGGDPVGPAEGLFAESFYRDLHRILAPGGVLSLQSEAPVLTSEVFAATQARLRRVFRRVHPCFAPAPLYSVGLWSWTVCSQTVDPRRLPAGAGDAVEPGCRYWSREIHEAAFVVPRYVAEMLGARGSSTRS